VIASDGLLGSLVQCQPSRQFPELFGRGLLGEEILLYLSHCARNG
jgi:hypothetical protein